MPKRLSIVAAALMVAVTAFGDAAAPDTLRVMTYNIHIGQGMDKKFDLPRIAEIIKKADVDVVALQEVDVKTRRSGNVDEPAELGRLTGMHVVFAKAIDHDGGEYGQAILSRQPIKNVEIHKLPREASEEQRICIFATIEQPQPLPDLLVVVTHLHHVGEPLRVKQAAEINRLLADRLPRRDTGLLLLGDLNGVPDGDVLKELRKNWDDSTAKAGPTFPADKPDRKIDYVLLPKGHRWDVVSSKVLDEPVASDHRPVVVELRAGR